MKPDEIEFDTAELARLVGARPKEIYELRRAGVITCASGGRFGLSAITEYVAHLRAGQTTV